MNESNNASTDQEARSTPRSQSVGGTPENAAPRERRPRSVATEARRAQVVARRIQMAEERIAWINSDEFKKFKRVIWLVVALLPICAAGGAIYTRLFVPNPDRGSYLSAIGAGALVWVLLGYVTLPAGFIVARREFGDRRLLANEHAELVRAEDEVAAGATDFPSLWIVTQKRLDYYHRIATTQAEQSFLYGQIAAGAGFVIVLVSVVVAAFAHSAVASISSVVSGLSGGGLGAFIGATFMKSQDTASVQLREYFRQPLDFSKYLAAERLLEQLDSSDRPAAIRRMIEAIVGAAPSDETVNGK